MTYGLGDGHMDAKSMLECAQLAAGKGKALQMNPISLPLGGIFGAVTKGFTPARRRRRAKKRVGRGRGGIRFSNTEVKSMLMTYMTIGLIGSVRGGH